MGLAITRNILRDSKATKSYWRPRLLKVLLDYEGNRWCYDTMMLAGPGRGSAAGSLVAYSLGITQVDPIKMTFCSLASCALTLRTTDIDYDISRPIDLKDKLIELWGEVGCWSQTEHSGWSHLSRTSQSWYDRWWNKLVTMQWSSKLRFTSRSTASGLVYNPMANWGTDPKNFLRRYQMFKAA